ncbi:MAG: hypothetical protein K1X53_13855 [Candidatus Sumerlaeaceae bacterium]|nr:hypothetical protein [Candidatus Sumerlaeaceae bacterium]
MTFPISIKTAMWQLAMVAIAATFAGCSDMKFVSNNVDENAPDSRTDIKLTGVTTDITSGAVVMNRIHGREAVFPNNRSRITMKDVKVEAYAADGKLQGATVADTGVVFLNDDPSAQRSKNDLVFEGNVVHRVPSATDPTTDTAQLNTNNLVWDNTSQRFLGNTYYQMVMNSPGKRPVRLVGDAFAVTQDLRKWDVKHGAMGGGGIEDPMARSKVVRSEMDKVRELVDAPSQAPQAKPQPLDVPNW